MLITIFLLFGFVSYTATSTAVIDDDFLGGEDIILEPQDARDLLDRTLLLPLPSDTQVLGFVEGGFQDKFWQFKLSVPTRDRDMALGALGGRQTDMTPFIGGMFAQPDDTFWDPSTHSDAQTGYGSIPNFGYTDILIAADPEDPGRTLIYVFTFQT